MLPAVLLLLSAGEDLDGCDSVESCHAEPESQAESEGGVPADLRNKCWSRAWSAPTSGCRVPVNFKLKRRTRGSVSRAPAHAVRTGLQTTPSTSASRPSGGSDVPAFESFRPPYSDDVRPSRCEGGLLGGDGGIDSEAGLPPNPAEAINANARAHARAPPFLSQHFYACRGGETLKRTMAATVAPV